MATIGKRTTKRVPTKSAVAGAKGRQAAKASVTPEERYKMIELAAYYRAERHGWQVDPTENWLAAEKEIDAQLRAGKIKK